MIEEEREKKTIEEREEEKKTLLRKQEVKIFRSFLFHKILIPNTKLNPKLKEKYWTICDELSQREDLNKQTDRKILLKEIKDRLKEKKEPK